MNGQASAKHDIGKRTARCWLCAIFAVGILLRALTTLGTPMGINLFSDDNAYLNSGITFLKTGYITYASPTLQSGVLGPGMPVVLGALFALFGYGQSGILLAHIAFSLFGVVTAWGAYLLAKLVRSRRAGVIAAALVALSPNLISTNSAFYTETPYMCFCLFAFYLLLSCAARWSLGRFLGGAACLCAAASFKGLALLVPVCVVPALIAWRVPFKKWIGKAGLLALIFALVFAPWCVRNSMVFGQFTPFPVSQGDQKLLGTYVGIGCPEGTYAEDIEALHQEAWDQHYETDTVRRQARVKEFADERTQQWLKQSPLGFAVTHIAYKPFTLLTSVFYPQRIFRLPEWAVQCAWYACVALALLGVALTPKARRGKGFWIPLLYLLVAVYLTSVYVPLGRYNVPHVPFVMIYAAIGLENLYMLIFGREKRRLTNS